jgi:hemerythrin-like domain-containing protein
MTEYEKLELLHSQLDELINGNQLPVDELKILQSFVEDIREKHFTNKEEKIKKEENNGTRPIRTSYK